MRSRQVGAVLLAAAGVAALALALLGRGGIFAVAVAVAVILLLLATNRRSPASRISSGLRPLVGAGLLLRLRSGGAEPVLLKIAQPKGARLEGRGLVVPEAAYVQWAGSRLPRVTGHPGGAPGGRP